MRVRKPSQAWGSDSGKPARKEFAQGPKQIEPPVVPAADGPLRRQARHSIDQVARPRICLADQLKPKPDTRTRALEPHEEQEVAYQLARQVTGDAIEDPAQIKRLVEHNESVHRTRAKLRHGRGNLQPDNEVTGGMSQKLTEASYILQDEHGMVAHVASALVLGAGNCDVYGLAAALEHAPKLQPGETVHAVSIPGFHTWSQSRSPDHPDIDGDGWANGPAIESSDANFQATNDKHDFTAEEGLELFEAVQAEAAAYANPESPLHRELKDALDEACSVSLKPPSYGVSNQVISAEFATNAREALAAQSAFTQQIVAVDVARRAYDVSVKVAARSAPAVAAVAHQLDDLPRPPVQPIEE